MLNRVFAIIISVLTVQTVVANVLMQTAFDSAALGGDPPNQPDAEKNFLGTTCRQMIPMIGNLSPIRFQPLEKINSSSACGLRKSENYFGVLNFEFSFSKRVG